MHLYRNGIWNNIHCQPLHGSHTSSHCKGSMFDTKKVITSINVCVLRMLTSMKHFLETTLYTRHTVCISKNDAISLLHQISATNGVLQDLNNAMFMKSWRACSRGGDSQCCRNLTNSCFTEETGNGHFLPPA